MPVNCPIDPSKFDIQTVRDLVNQKKFEFLKGNPNDTVEDVIARRKILQGLFTTELVDNSKLTKGLHLDGSGKTSRYVWIDTKELAVQGRVTDKNKAAFVKRRGKEASDELSNLPDNEVKRNAGTKFHKAAQDITNIFKNKYAKFIENPPSKEELKTVQEISDELGLNPQDFGDPETKTGLFYEIERLVKLGIDVQNSIDPTKKVFIQAEDFNLDTDGSKGGTADLLFIYSDKSASLFDYKTMTPHYSKLDATGNIVKEDWIPGYKIEEFNVQLPTLMDMYKKTGIKNFRHARIIPVQIGFVEKKKADPTKKEGARLTNAITTIRMGEDSDKKKFLTPIPITLESTGVAGLDEALSKANKLKHNLTKRLERLADETAEAFKLRGRIKKLNSLINSIMLKKDIKGFTELYNGLIQGYLDVNRTLKSDYLEEGNNLYLNLSKIDDLLSDLQLFKAIANSTPDFIKSIPEDKANALDRAAYFANLDTIAGVANNLEEALKQRAIDLTLNLDDKAAMLGDKNLTWFDKLFRRFSNINNTIFKKARTIIEGANTKTRLDLMKFTDKLDKLNKEVQVWSAANGLGGFKVYDLLINKKSGNLHTKFKTELYDTLEEARREKDDKTLDSMVKLKEDYKELYQAALQKHMIINSYTMGDIQTNKDLIEWINENNPDLKSSTSKYSDYWYKYYEIDPSKVSENLLNPEYAKIRSTPALLNYYNFWEESMEQFRSLLDIQYTKVPNNFIPWIKGNTMEQLMNGSTVFSKENFMNIMSVQENNTILYQESYITLRGEIDPATGLQKREIPKYFINPLVNNQGDIDNTLKSFDLSSSLAVFAQMAFSYNNLKHTESTIEALKDILAEKGVNQTTAEGKEVRINNDQKAQTEEGPQTEESKLFEDMINYHLYGVFYKDKPSKFKQGLLKVKQYQQIKELAISPISNLVNLMGARTNAFFEGDKGYFYTKTMWGKSLKDRYSNEKKPLYFALANFIQPYAGKPEDRKSMPWLDKVAKMGKNNLAQNINYNTLFAGFRVGDEHIDEQVMYSMLQNYGLDKNNNLVRLNAKRLEEGLKSLLDNSRIEGEALIVEGLIDKDGNVNAELYSQLRNLVLNTTTTIKGGLNSEDMNAANMTVIGKLFMSFRNWLPALAEERFRGVDNILSQQSLRYNPQTNTVTEARYTALLSDVVDPEAVGVLNLVKYVGLASAKLAANMLPFVKNSKFAQVNENRARVLYDNFLKENEHLPAVKNGSLTFEDFLEYKQGQIRALATEITYMLTLLVLLGILGGGFDDDDKFAKKNWATRQSYRILNRYRRELMGIVNPGDWVTLLNNPLPILGLAINANKTIQNTFDEGFDEIFGEAEGRGLVNIMGNKKIKDKKEKLYYLYKWIPGYKFINLFEPTKTTETSKY